MGDAFKLDLSGDALAKELDATKTLLRQLSEDAKYFSRAIESELSALESNDAPTPLDILRARGYVLAHAQRHDLAILDLNAVVSQREGATAHNLNKLAQVLTRRGLPEDCKRAVELTKTLIEGGVAKDEGERWFAFHNRAAAYLGLGETEAAEIATKQAFELRKDPRTEALRLQIDTLRTTDESDGGNIAQPSDKLATEPPIVLSHEMI